MARDVRNRNPPNNIDVQNGMNQRWNNPQDRVQYSSTDSEYEQHDNQHSDQSTAGEADEAEQGEQLYRQFLAERGGQIRLVSQFSTDPLQTDIISLAERFSGSADREQVRQRAEEVDISSLSPENFNSMLSELFHDGGVTQERLLVLFFFCSDLALRACRSGMTSICQAITNWSLGFIRITVASLVRVQGGWSRVLRGQPTFSDSVVVLTSLALVATSVFMYIKKS